MPGVKGMRWRSKPGQKDQHPLYNVWRNMRRRCEDPKHHKYELYGGRGIVVCFRWWTFENFLEDMGVRPDGYLLDREDNDGDYEPRNCRWVDVATSLKNRRGCRARRGNPIQP